MALVAAQYHCTVQYSIVATDNPPQREREDGISGRTGSALKETRDKRWRAAGISIAACSLRAREREREAERERERKRERERESGPLRNSMSLSPTTLL